MNKLLTFSTFGLLLLSIAFLIHTAYFHLYYAPSRVLDYTMTLEPEYNTVARGGTIRPTIYRCVTGGVHPALIETYIGWNDVSGTQVEETIARYRQLGSLNVAYEQNGNECKTFLGNERTIPLDIEPGRYFLRNEITITVKLGIIEKDISIIAETPEFVVLEGSINGNGASDGN